VVLSNALFAATCFDPASSRTDTAAPRRQHHPKEKKTALRETKEKRKSVRLKESQKDEFKFRERFYRARFLSGGKALLVQTPKRMWFYKEATK
jgi:hypothetical protein